MAGPPDVLRILGPEVAVHGAAFASAALNPVTAFAADSVMPPAPFG
ncbi:hypothetical protein KZ829_40220 [Actinoplanes hulinensis]|uniref:Uncharacterized protein n=1 Tax=Actinoplanes hulinensis TaxID=1144547 RepID=A0ABS7BGN7_9ACTN|nr:hypothetical protein [Actinoplanes hulinensis]MBW6439972.1 hypothetical protein [Actinoplanes hulinensis]